MKIRRGTFLHIELELMCYQDSLKEIENIKKEIIHGSVFIEPDSGGRSNLPSNPTERKATSIITNKRLRQLEEITQAIQSVYDSVIDDKKKLIKIRYWTKPQVLTWDGIALQLNVHRVTAINWRNEIILMIAHKLGWK